MEVKNWLDWLKNFRNRRQLSVNEETEPRQALLGCADIHAVDENGSSVIHACVELGETDIVKSALELGVSVNAINFCGDSPLHVGAEKNDARIVTFLLEYGANVNAQNFKGNTPLHICSRKKLTDIACALLGNNADSNMQNFNGYTPLHFSAHMGHTEITKLLLKHRADPNIQAQNGYTALHYSAFHGRRDIVSLLQQNGADVDKRDKYGISPLHWSARRGYKEIVDLLISRNADPNASNKNGHTPLHWSVYMGHIEIAKLLLTHNADINAKTEHGHTPLHVSARNRHDELFNFLISKGAATDILDKEGLTALDYIQKRPEPSVICQSNTVSCALKANANDNTSGKEICSVTKPHVDDHRLQQRKTRLPLSDRNTFADFHQCTPHIIPEPEHRHSAVTGVKDISESGTESEPKSGRVQRVSGVVQRKRKLSPESEVPHESASEQHLEKDLRPFIEKIFVYFVKTRNTLHVFSKYIGTTILTREHIDQIKAETDGKGEIAGARKLFNLLPWTEATYSCTLDVLKDPQVQLQHAAELMKKCRELKTDAADQYIKRNDCLVSKIIQLFADFITPSDMLHFFHRYSRRVLTKIDIEHINTIANRYGNIQSSLQLLDYISIYEDWFPCLLSVLRDSNVKLGHVADMMQNIHLALLTEDV